MKNNSKTISELILQTQGIDLSKYEETFLNKAVQKRMKETFCQSETAYYTYLEQSHIESEIFIHSLEISYTEFFRNTLTFSVLEKILIPSLVLRKAKSKRNEIRIWSAACAAGQETYSLAMLFKEYSTFHGERINFRIFATDQSETQIEDAQSGEYPESALNNLNLRRVKHWFTRHGDTYSVKPEIKESIDFSVFDLLSDQFSCPPTSIFGDFDLIVCANLLFYYKHEYQQKIIQKGINCLSENGYLITGETEREILTKTGLHEVYPHTGIFQV
ncbi:MAG: protein-glutamate O-methyltransferase CheR [Paludibacter sp.]|nr:protein-glutamate O-methyltransferase CheR [Paludibacter sp.]